MMIHPKGSNLLLLKLLPPSLTWAIATQLDAKEESAIAKWGSPPSLIPRVPQEFHWTGLLLLSSSYSVEHTASLCPTTPFLSLSLIFSFPHPPQHTQWTLTPRLKEPPRACRASRRRIVVIPWDVTSCRVDLNKRSYLAGGIILTCEVISACGLITELTLDTSLRKSSLPPAISIGFRVI